MVQHDKTSLVTGASRGIGRATALALAETGAHVLVHYGRSDRYGHVEEVAALLSLVAARSPHTLPGQT
jgi:NAD(P)-dependent dehydrogenase (short-subunit alcohol dehydrogenase family)